MTPAPSAAPLTGGPDHLVVYAASLDEGAAWCEATLGITPGPGGEHPRMGTHNRLFKIASAAFPAAYFEIIAINSKANFVQPTGGRRWFDMDSAELRAQVSQHGPQLVHWVARVPDAAVAVARLAGLGIDRGEVVRASRPTPRGLLEWQISVREDGQRLFNGVLPTVIQWGAVHPTTAMPDSGVALQSLTLSSPEAPALNTALQAIGLHTPVATHGAARLRATLSTPRGPVTLESAVI